MLLLSPLREQQQPHSSKDEIHRAGGDPMESFSNVVDFSDFTGGGNLLDTIDFDDLFIGIDSEMDVLPDLEMDSGDNMLAEFSVSCGEDESDVVLNNNNNNNTSPMISSSSLEKWEEAEAEETNKTAVDVDHHHHQNQNQKVDYSGSGTTNLKGSTSSNNSTHGGGGGGEEIDSKRDERAVNHGWTPKQEENTDKSRKSSSSSSSSSSKSSHGKRKVKVDWTPELHRRFVQAVEQLGVDKAVPSRILELMGIDCLTRHNIASHLQKYRSHRKHLLAREAEAASWTQRRQMYGSGAAGVNKRPASSSEMGPWLAPPPPPTMGFPPPPPMHHHGHQFRPVHVWGHPTSSADQSISMMHMWPPKHLAPFPPSSWPPAPPPPPPPPPDTSSYWHHHHQRVPPPTAVLTPGTPCFPRQMATTTHTPAPTLQRFSAPVPVAGIPPHPAGIMYKQQLDAGQSGPHPLVDFQPSKESIDAAIGDALSKPWLPLPLGLKPPSTDSVMGELQRQGIPKVPPSSSSSGPPAMLERT